MSKCLQEKYHVYIHSARQIRGHKLSTVTGYSEKTSGKSTIPKVSKAWVLLCCHRALSSYPKLSYLISEQVFLLPFLDNLNL